MLGLSQSKAAAPVSGPGRSRPALQAAPRRQGLAPAPRDVATWAKKKKAGRVIVTIECTEAKKEGGTPSRYVTEKNKRNTPERLELRKYNKFLHRHTLHKETK